MALIGAGVTTTIPAVIPQTIMAAESEYQVTRNIKLFIQQADGSKKLHGTLPQTMKVPVSISKDYKLTFPAVEVSSMLGEGFEIYTPDRTTIPSAKGSFNNPPADEEVTLTIDPDKGLTEGKNIVRTIKYYIKDENGIEALSAQETYTLMFPRGASLNQTATFPDKNVPLKAGYTADRTVIKGKTVKASDSSFTEKVVYTKNPNVTTETKTVWRKINFIDKDTGKQIRGSQSHGVNFSREVYKDANGKTVVVRDWQAEGTIPEFTVPDIEGYSHTQKTVPAKTVTVTTKDYEVNVYYLSTRFTVNYHLDDSSAASSKKTVVDYGIWTKTRTLSDLGFLKSGFSFIGWKAYREIDDKWYVKNPEGKNVFIKLINGELPEGYSFVIYKNGAQTRTIAQRGNVHFYGIWQENKFTIKYHLDESGKASDKTTTVKYGEVTKTLKLSDLEFSMPGKKFVGWKAYREIDDKWYVKNTDGKNVFMKLINGELPSGYSFVRYLDGATTHSIAKSGIVHFYGMWK